MTNYPLQIPDDEFDKLIAPAPFAKGGSRLVYRVPSDSTVVVKKTIKPFPGSNMIEWFVWQGVKETAFKNVFAACISISESGRYLMMEALEPIEQIDRADLPEVPHWVNDRKENAFGKTGGVIKMLDYGVVEGSWLDLSTPENYALRADAQFNRRLGKPGW